MNRWPRVTVFIEALFLFHTPIRCLVVSPPFRIPNWENRLKSVSSCLATRSKVGFCWMTSCIEVEKGQGPFLSLFLPICKICSLEQAVYRSFRAQIVSVSNCYILPYSSSQNERYWITFCSRSVFVCVFIFIHAIFRQKPKMLNARKYISCAVFFLILMSSVI